MRSLIHDRRSVTASVSLLVVLLCAITPRDAPRAWRPKIPASAVQTDPAQQSALQSIDGLIKVFYESLSFPRGKAPDWERFRVLFASATSPCVRMTSDGVMGMDREGFIAFFSGRIKQGTLKSFDEKEIGRTTEVYGSLAQVFSAYEKRMNLDDPGKAIRGINGFQLFFKDNRWWISSIAWQDELPDKPIPQKYLKRG